MAEVVNSIIIEQDGQLYDLYKLPDGFVIKGDLKLTNCGLTKLPDLSKVKVEGNFDCSFNQLTDLNGAPKEVGGVFWCRNNQLSDLKGAPEKVGGNFGCHENQLTDLNGAPKEVGGSFYCGRNQLTDLNGAPEKVGGDFWCECNQLTDFNGVPNEVRDFVCFGNKRLTSLKDIPQEIGGLLYADKELLQKYSCTEIDKYGNAYAYPNSLRESPLFKEEKQQDLIDEKAKSLRNKIMRTIAAENVLPEKGVVNPKRSPEEKAIIGAALKKISKEK